MTVYRSIERLKDLHLPADLKKILHTILLIYPPDTQLLIYLLNEAQNTLDLINGAGKGWEETVSHYSLEGSIPGLCLKSGSPVEVETGGDGRWQDLTDSGLIGFNRAICMPIHANGTNPWRGILYIKFRKGKGFTNEERRVAKASSLLIADLYSLTQRLCLFRRGLAEQLLLEEVSRALLRHATDLDRLLYIVLTFFTAYDGLGFNRAMFFLLNKRMGRLEGVAGIGPESPEEAGRVWREMEKENFDLKRLIALAEGRMFEQGGFNRYIRSLRFDLKKGSILTETVGRMRPFNVAVKRCPYDCSEIVEKLGADTFAILPLIGSEGVLGVFIVDNLYNKKPITEEDIDILMAICRQAGLAVENALLYAKVKEAKRRLIHDEKMVALGEMAAALAHSIKNPLVSIGGLVRRIRKGVEPGLEERYLEGIEKEVRRLEGTLEEILTFSQKKSAMEECRVDEIVEEALLLMGEDLKDARIDVVKEIDPSIPSFKGDRGQLVQALLNLISNARQAMTEGGSLRIGTHTYMEDDEMWINIEVEDTGGGIPPEILDNIFDPFFTTKEKGTGLGLSIVHTIVKNHGGRIEVKNMPGKGAVFSLKLPILLLK